MAHSVFSDTSCIPVDAMTPRASLRPAKPKSRKSLVPFKEEHALQYGLKIAHRNPATSAVSSCICRVCVAFGRETADAAAAGQAKRKKTTKMQSFSTFRTDLYRQHLNLAHPQKWAAYQLLESDVDRNEFFGSVVPFQERLHAHFEMRNSELCINISSAIVETVIGDLLFHPDGMNGLTRKRALALFTSSDDGNYTIVIKTAKRFSMFIGAVAFGASFRMAARFVQLVRDETDLMLYTGCNDTIASNYVRVVCASALQDLINLMCGATGFSLALDSSTLQSVSYLDIRVRLVVNGALHNFHLLALPLFGAHTSLLMCEALVELMDAVCPVWRDSLVGVSTDGEPKMTGRVRGLATLIEKETTAKKLIRVWCGLHQLHLVMQRVHEGSFNGAFMSTLTAVIGHLRRQQLLISRMRSICPKVVDTRWMSMFNCTSWFTRNIITIQEYYANKTPPAAVVLDTAWWVFLFAVNSLIQEANAVFVNLQSQTTLLSQQRATLAQFITTLSSLTGMEGPHDATVIMSLIEEEQHPAEICDKFILRHSSAEAYLIEPDPWIEAALTTLPATTKSMIVSAVAKMFVEAVCGIYGNVAERNSDNTPGTDLPFVLPHQLVAPNMPTFNRVLDAHRGRLQRKLDPASIHHIGQDFVQLKRLYRNDEATRASIDATSDTTTQFEDAWSATGSQLPHLLQFCGDIASVFPNTATVESDFSVLGWEKNAYRHSLTDFSLEGILHSKQYRELQRLARVAGVPDIAKASH